MTIGKARGTKTGQHPRKTMGSGRCQSVSSCASRDFDEQALRLLNHYRRPSARGAWSTQTTCCTTKAPTRWLGSIPTPSGQPARRKRCGCGADTGGKKEPAKLWPGRKGLLPETRNQTLRPASSQPRFFLRELCLFRTSALIKTPTEYR
jgi:hypothetical protein